MRTIVLVALLLLLCYSSFWAIMTVAQGMRVRPMVQYGNCQECGRGTLVARFTFERYRGWGFFVRTSTMAGHFCADCADRLRSEALAHTLRYGWFSPYFAYTQPLALINDFVARRRIRKLRDRPSGRTPPELFKG